MSDRDLIVPPPWRLPEGVDGPLWRYAHESRLAADEDRYFAGNPLFAADAEALASRFATPGRIIDLGCGAGRHSIQFARSGFDVVSVDLSRPMVEMVRSKSHSLGLSDRVCPIQANVCRLDCLPDGRFDYAVSMFSTLGMIRTRPARRRALAEAHRVLRPGGKIALHAHNVWLNLDQHQGRIWLLRDLGRRIFRREGQGDRTMTYRGMPDMTVHMFRWRELLADLQSARFAVDEILPIDQVTARPIGARWLLPQFRAGGWIVFASR